MENDLSSVKTENMIVHCTAATKPFSLAGREPHYRVPYVPLHLPYSTRTRVHFPIPFLFIVVVLRFPLTSCVFTCHLIIYPSMFIKSCSPETGKPITQIRLHLISEVGYVGARRSSCTQWTVHQKHIDGDTFQMSFIIFE